MEDISQKIAKTIRAYLHAKGGHLQLPRITHTGIHLMIRLLMFPDLESINQNSGRGKNFVLLLDFNGHPTFGYEKIRPSAETLVV